MKTILFLLIAVFCIEVSAQCNIKTTVRPDGHTMKYFNPTPIIRLSNYEVGASVYKNINTQKFFLSITVLFKTETPKMITGSLTIQTSGEKGLVLPLSVSEEVIMNNRKVSVALYEISKENLAELEEKDLKSVFFYLDGKMFGSNLTENKTTISHQIKCLK
jgi:hypothetical protein